MKHIELAKKIKALADKGIDGEKINAQKMLNNLLKKYKITIADIEEEETQDYGFQVEERHSRLFVQLVWSVNFDIKVFGTFSKTKMKKWKIKGNWIATCTAAQFIEIKTMFEHYSALYDSEFDVFFGAFAIANDLLVSPPIEKQTRVDDLSAEEKELLQRKESMATKIKSETYRKKLNAQN